MTTKPLIPELIAKRTERDKLRSATHEAAHALLGYIYGSFKEAYLIHNETPPDRIMDSKQWVGQTQFWGGNVTAEAAIAGAIAEHIHWDHEANTEVEDWVWYFIEGFNDDPEEAGVSDSDCDAFLEAIDELSAAEGHIVSKTAAKKCNHTIRKVFHILIKLEPQLFAIRDKLLDEGGVDDKDVERVLDIPMFSNANHQKTLKGFEKLGVEPERLVRTESPFADKSPVYRIEGERRGRDCRIAIEDGIVTYTKIYYGPTFQSDSKRRVYYGIVQSVDLGEDKIPKLVDFQPITKSDLKKLKKSSIAAP